jgi:hypothetical protein
MPRTKNPIDPALTGPVANFARDLRELRDRAGNPSYDVMARTGHGSKSNLSTADQGRKLPTRETLHAYVKGCGGSDHDLHRLEVRRAQIQGQLSGEPPSPAGRGRRRRGSVDDLPDPHAITSLPALLDHLRLIKEWAGKPTFKDLEEHAEAQGLYLPRSTAGDMLKKERLPKLDTLQAFLTVCGVPDEHRSALAHVHQGLADIQHHRRLAARQANVEPLTAPDSLTPGPDRTPVMQESPATRAAAAESLARMTGESGVFRAMDEADSFVRDIGTAEWQQIDPAYPRQWPADPRVHPTWAQRIEHSSAGPLGPFESTYASSSSPQWSPEKAAAVNGLNAEADRVLTAMGEETLLRPGIRRIPVPRRPEATYRFEPKTPFTEKTTPRPDAPRMQYRPLVPDRPLRRAHRPRHLRGILRSSRVSATASDDAAVRQQALEAAEDPWDAWADPPGGGLGARRWEGSVAGKVLATIAAIFAMVFLAFLAVDRSAEPTVPTENAATSGTSPDPQVFADLAVLWDKLRRDLYGLSPSPGP